ncbi:hypothetical protein [Acinetobacter baretiae]|uniref:hypothetical protein n=1 Tax=Acinetobacter baretiae TaxID=2605383 RepID=UPI001F1CC578|nr:hypothetical protein [Acinetobacter baretiae]
MAEFIICLVCVMMILNIVSDIWGTGSIFMDMKNAYELFLNKFNSTILNLDVIP